MAELVDAADSKSAARKGMRVRVSLPAPREKMREAGWTAPGPRRRLFSGEGQFRRGIMAKAQVRVLPSARNTVMVVDDQSTGRAILEQVVRGLDERIEVEGFMRPVDAVVWAARHVA